MRSLNTLLMVLALMWSVFIGDALAAQQRRAERRPDETKFVEVVGCLSSGPNGTWTLKNATEPAVSRTAIAAPDAVKSAAATSLGTHDYLLLGVTTNWDPLPHKGHKMAVKGLLIQANPLTRINVTSFQMASTGCSK